jgi:hypothetical protein
MKKLLFIMAVWLLPVSANAQSMRLDFDADAYYDPPASAAAATAEQSAAPTATSSDKARTVRHGERTVMVANGVSAAPGTKTKLAAQNPY